MNIVKGVKIILADCDDPFKKVFINDGVESCIGSDSTKFAQYDERAYKPKNNFRPINNSEASILITSSEKIDYSESILLKKLPEHLINYLQKIDYAKSDSYTNLLSKFKEQSEYLIKFQTEIQDQLDLYLQKNTKASFHRIVYNPPNTETLTYYLENYKLYFVGLHFDKSTLTNFSNCKHSKNRICINIGIEDRTLYFINLSVEQIVRLLDEKNIITNDISLDELNELFFKNYPDYPVIKIIQRPYEFYIFPTDNVLHDGSSLGKRYHDICLVYLGYFNTYESKVELKKV